MYTLYVCIHYLYILTLYIYIYIYIYIHTYIYIYIYIYIKMKYYVKFNWSKTFILNPQYLSVTQLRYINFLAAC